MAIIRGPKIVRSGLVLALDAADRNSYIGSGTTWKDLSGNNYNGTLTNSPTFSSANGGSVVFDGTNDYVDLVNSTELNFTNTSATVSVWFKTSTSFASGVFLIAKNMLGIAGGGGWGLLINSSGIPYFNTKNNVSGGTSIQRLTNLSCNDGVWHNFVVVFTTSTTVVGNNTASVYLDGRLSNGTLTQSLVYSGNTTGTVQLARRSSSDSYYTGNISSLQIYNRELTASEILQNYNAVKSRFGL